MNLTVNGSGRSIADGATIQTLLEMYDLADERVAVEHNGDIVPRATFATVRLADGDHLEVVRFVGGG